MHALALARTRPIRQWIPLHRRGRHARRRRPRGAPSRSRCVRVGSRLRRPAMRLESLGEAVFVRRSWSSSTETSGLACLRIRAGRTRSEIGAFIWSAARLPESRRHAGYATQLLDDMRSEKILKESGGAAGVREHGGMVAVRWQSRCPRLDPRCEKNAFPAARYNVVLRRRALDRAPARVAPVFRSSPAGSCSEALRARGLGRVLLCYLGVREARESASGRPALMPDRRDPSSSIPSCARWC